MENDTKSDAAAESGKESGGDEVSHADADHPSSKNNNKKIKTRVCTNN